MSKCISNNININGKSIANENFSIIKKTVENITPNNTWQTNIKNIISHTTNNHFDELYIKNISILNNSIITEAGKDFSIIADNIIIKSTNKIELGIGANIKIIEINDSDIICNNNVTIFNNENDGDPYIKIGNDTDSLKIQTEYTDSATNLKTIKFLSSSTEGNLESGSYEFMINNDKRLIIGDQYSATTIRYSCAFETISITSDYTPTYYDYTIICILPLTINLPNPSLSVNRVHIIKNITNPNGIVTIDPNGYLLDSSMVPILLNNSGDCIMIQSNGTQWIIIGIVNV